VLKERSPITVDGCERKLTLSRLLKLSIFLPSYPTETKILSTAVPILATIAPLAAFDPL